LLDLRMFREEYKVRSWALCHAVFSSLCHFSPIQVQPFSWEPSSQTLSVTMSGQAPQLHTNSTSRWKFKMGSHNEPLWWPPNIQQNSRPSKNISRHPHALPTLSSLTWSFQLYSEKSTS
jgi:hypothetical protein